MRCVSYLRLKTRRCALVYLSEDLMAKKRKGKVGEGGSVRITGVKKSPATGGKPKPGKRAKTQGAQSKPRIAAGYGFNRV